MSDHEYEVEHNKRNRPEIPRGRGGKTNNIIYNNYVHANRQRKQ